MVEKESKILKDAEPKDNPSYMVGLISYRGGLNILGGIN
jgi:hypothetical protein